MWKETQLNKPLNTPERSLLLSSYWSSFLLPFRANFLLLPSKIRSCFTSIFYSKLFILLKVTSNLPVSKRNGISHFHLSAFWSRADEPCLLQSFLPIMTLIFWFSSYLQTPLSLYKALYLLICQDIENKANKSAACNGIKRKMHFRDICEVQSGSNRH